MGSLPIYNCHIHTFTVKHVPRHFLPLGLGQVLQWKPLATLFAWIAPYIIPWKTGDILERFARFVTVGGMGSQEAIFKEIQRYYPEGTRFVVLPMDMVKMGAGPIPEDLEAQQRDLMRLAQQPEYNGLIIPFCAVDPRRTGVVELAKRWIKQDGFRGVKLYPRLGYRPDHPELVRLYTFLQEEDVNVPVMAHCSTGPSAVGQRGLSYEEAAEFGHPRHYEKILKDFPKVRFCLAHFGGGEEWERQLRGDVEPAGPQRTWVRWIRDMIESGDYPNLYTDISMTIFDGIRRRRPVDYLDYLKVLLANPRVRDHVLYGSDYYMVKLAKLTEKEASILLRSRLGEELYFQIAHHNPLRYLNG